jgi:hypothetical protein
MKPGDSKDISASRILHFSKCGAAQYMNIKAAQRIKYDPRACDTDAHLCCILFFKVLGAIHPVTQHHIPEDFSCK